MWSLLLRFINQKIDSRSTPEVKLLEETGKDRDQCLRICITIGASALTITLWVVIMFYAKKKSCFRKFMKWN